MAGGPGAALGPALTLFGATHVQDMIIAGDPRVEAALQQYDEGDKEQLGGEAWGR